MWQFIAFSIRFAGPAFGRRSQPRPRCLHCQEHRCRRSIYRDSLLKERLIKKTRTPLPLFFFYRLNLVAYTKTTYVSFYLFAPTIRKVTGRPRLRPLRFSTHNPPVIVRQDPYSPLSSGLEPRCTETRTQDLFDQSDPPPHLAFFPSIESGIRLLLLVASRSADHQGNAEPVKDRKVISGPPKTDPGLAFCTYLW